MEEIITLRTKSSSRLKRRWKKYNGARRRLETKRREERPEDRDCTAKKSPNVV